MGAKFRHEMKYVIPLSMYHEMTQVFREFLRYDPHTGPTHEYNIRSLYFDDLYGTAYQEKLDGVQYRKKYRIRIYNSTDKTIALECKHKDGPYIFKESVKITRAQYDQILRGDTAFLLHHPAPMAQEFAIDCRTSLLRPKVIVEYDREPMIYDVGTVRITFDKLLRAMEKDEDMFDLHAPSLSIMGPEQMILEVKFTGLLPEKIRRLFTAYEIVQTNASKYCMCVDRVEGTLMHTF